MLQRYMREGLEADDVFIMVEDEFLTIAKTFTQHLHHAEYVRLKQSARARNSSTATSIARPVDSVTQMREELKRQKAAQSMSAAQNRTLDSVMETADDVKTEGDQSDLDEDKADDPWVGTSLQSLMTSPKREQRSLARLSKASSGTRAAAGFKNMDRTFARSPNNHLGKQADSNAHESEENLASTEEEDDDLEAPVYKKAPIKESRDPSPSPGDFKLQRYDNELTLRTDPGKDPPHNPNKSSPLSSGFPDALPTPSPFQGQAATRIEKRLAEMRAKKAGKQRQEPKKPVSLGEIPTFLL